MAKLESVRPVGPLEQFSSARHDIGVYRRLATTCRYRYAGDAVPDASLHAHFLAALASLVQALPGLRVAIADESTQKPYFAAVTSIDVAEHVEWVQLDGGEDVDTQILAALQKEQDQLWPDIGARAPWKVLVMQHPVTDVVLDVSFLLHHGIGDGISTTIVHRKLREALNTPIVPTEVTSGSNDHHILTFPTKPDMPPAQEAVIKWSTTFLFLLSVLWKELAPAWLKGTPTARPWAGKAPSLEPYRTRLRLVTIPASTVPHLVAACRAHNTTLTGLAHALICTSLSRRLDKEQASCFSSFTPISMRPWVLPGPHKDAVVEGMGNLVTSFYYVFSPETVAALRESREVKGAEEQQMWKVAAEMRAALQDKMASLPKNDAVALIPWAGDLQKFWLNKIGKPRETTWEVSNLGVMDGGLEKAGDAEWKVERAFMTQPAAPVAGAINTCMAGVRGGPVTLSISWQDTVVEDQLIEGLRSDLQGWVDEFGRSRSFGI